jgi:hypothetical protein
MRNLGTASSKPILAQSRPIRIWLCAWQPNHPWRCNHPEQAERPQEPGYTECRRPFEGNSMHESKGVIRDFKKDFKSGYPRSGTVRTHGSGWNPPDYQRNESRLGDSETWTTGNVSKGAAGLVCTSETVKRSEPEPSTGDSANCSFSASQLSGILNLEWRNPSATATRVTTMLPYQ